MKSDINGCSTCPAGEEHYETFRPSRRSREPMVQYDYRAPDGVLFSCVGKSLATCRARRDEWLAKRQARQEATCQTA